MGHLHRQVIAAAYVAREAAELYAAKPVAADQPAKKKKAPKKKRAR